MFFRSRKRNRRSQFGIEQLECRNLPTVTLNLVGHHLFIKADNSGEVVDIEGTGKGKVDVTENGDTHSYTGVKVITARFGSGDDELNVTDLDIARNLIVRMGRGDDFLKLDNVDIGGRTALTLGAGTDTVEIIDSQFSKRASILLQGGDDELIIDGNDFNRRAVANGGSGTDTLDDAGNNNFSKRHAARKFEDEV